MVSSVLYIHQPHGAWRMEMSDQAFKTLMWVGLGLSIGVSTGQVSVWLAVGVGMAVTGMLGQGSCIRGPKQ